MMESTQYFMQIRSIRCRINEEANRAVKALIAMHKGMLEILMEIERSDKKMIEKLEYARLLVENFEKNNKKFLLGMSKEASFMPVWTCLGEEGSFRLMDIGIFLSESKFGDYSVYQSNKDKNLLFICDLKLVSFAY